MMRGGEGRVSLSGVGDLIQDDVLNVFLFRDCCFSSFFCLFPFISAVSNSLAATDCFPWRKGKKTQKTFILLLELNVHGDRFMVCRGGAGLEVSGTYRVHSIYHASKALLPAKTRETVSTTRTGVKVVQGTSPVQPPREQVLRWYRVPRQFNHDQNRC